MQTLITSLISTNTPDKVHIYVLDYGGRFLRPLFEGFPHVGQVITPDDPERIERLFAMLENELSYRQERLGEANVPTFTEYIKEYEDLPALVFVVDNYSWFQKDNEDDIERSDLMLRLTGEGAGLGIYMVLTMRSPLELRSNLANNIVNALTFRLV